MVEGLSERITVNGFELQQHHAADSLTDEQVAAVLTFIRKDWNAAPEAHGPRR